MKLPSVAEMVDLISQLADRSLEKGDAESFLAFSSCLGGIKAELREQMQQATRRPIEAILGKLRSRQALSPEELGILRLWIVGDAEAYVRQENNLKDWFAEVRRIVSEIQKFRTVSPDAKGVLDLQGLVVDLDRNLQDIIHLLEGLERMNRFSETTREIDAEESEVFARILERKLRSQEM